MTHPLGHDCNGKPIYAGSLDLVVNVYPGNESRLGKVGAILGPDEWREGVLVIDIPPSPGYSQVCVMGWNVMVIDPLSEDTQEERELEHVL